MKKLTAKLRAFLRSERGNIAMMFAVALVPIMIGAGVGLDFARAMLVRQQMGEALDAAALAVGSSNGLSQATALALAQKYFDANYTVDRTAYGAPVVTIPTAGYNSTGSVLITATNSMPTLLVKLVGVSTLPVTTSSNVIWGQSKLWVALVLDNSGSMSQGDATGSKMSALQSASHQLLTILQNAATNPGDVKVGIVPFTRSVNMGESSYVGSAFIDWGEWDAPPINAAAVVTSSVGPGSACPFSTGTTGYRCTTGSANGSSNTNTVPASGLICPGSDNGSVNTAHNARYYNGCYDSVPTNTLTTTTAVSTPVTLTQTCTQVGAGAITCNAGSHSTGSATTNTTTATTPGYNGNSTSSSSSSSTGAPNDGSHTCHTSHGVTTCTWTRTTVTTTVVTTVTLTGVAPYSHTWTSNSHTSWSGCVTDRQRGGVQTMTTAGLRTAPAADYDTTDTQPSSVTPDTQFPAENPSSCPAATVTILNYTWATLGTQIDAMAPGGSTNQAIGVEHGWQMLTTGDPYTTPALPANTARYIIMVSDGLNTQDRWWGNGSTEGTTQDGYIDTQEETTCDRAKADGVVIYAIYVNVGNVGGAGNSAPLRYCATDATKYYALTSNSAVVTTFNQIAQQITNVRVVR